MKFSFLRQAAIRVFALSLPLVVVVTVRQLGDAEFIPLFFTLLTDTALIVAFCKVGVDVYLPSCIVEGKTVVVQRNYKVLYILVGLLMILAAALSYGTDGYWQLFLTATAVLSCLGLAEVGRLRGNFLLFYFLKSPVLYIGALLVALLVDQRFALVLFTALIGVIWFIFSKSLKGEDGEISRRALFLSAAVSLAILLFSWKEAALSRFIFNGESIDSLVMYSRFVLIVTFPFMLQNARVPLLLRNLDSGATESIVKATLSHRRLMMCMWAIVTSGLIVAYAFYAENELALGVGYLMAGACVLIVFGNIGAALVFYRKYQMLLVSYLGGAIAFLVTAGALLLMDTTASVFTIVSFSSLVAQLGFSVLLVYYFSCFCRQGDFTSVVPNSGSALNSKQLGGESL